MGDGDTEADKEATCQEHSNVDTDALQDNSEKPICVSRNQCLAEGIPT